MLSPVFLKKILYIPRVGAKRKRGGKERRRGEEERMGRMEEEKRVTI
jgi:hypothetical protein